VCANSTGEPWITPVASTLTTHSSRVAVSAQRARGYVDKIAKYVRQVGWAGSRIYRDKALTRCQLAHRLLGESIKREYSEWTEKLQMEQAYNVNAAMLKFAARRHFQRAEWIQSNLDGVVFQVLQTAEAWDRQLIDVPGQISSLFQERNELRNVYGSVCAMCHYFNYLVTELASANNEKHDEVARRSAIAKLEKAVQPCLSEVTWKQLIALKRAVSAVFFTMDEIIQDLNTDPDST